jgi:hypothetical protein
MGTCYDSELGPVLTVCGKVSFLYLIISPLISFFTESGDLYDACIRNSERRRARKRVKRAERRAEQIAHLKKPFICAWDYVASAVTYSSYTVPSNTVYRTYTLYRMIRVRGSP